MGVRLRVLGEALLINVKRQPILTRRFIHLGLANKGQSAMQGSHPAVLPLPSGSEKADKACALAERQSIKYDRKDCFF